MGIEAIYLQSSQWIKVSNLTNLATGLPIGAASVTADIVDASDAEVPGETWPLTLFLVDGTQADYQATTKVLTLTLNADYFIRITADAGGGLQGYWRVPCRAIYAEG